MVNIVDQIKEITMKVTEYGKIVRKARIDADLTMLDMAEDLGVSSAYLSALEVGRKRVPENFLGKDAPT